MIPAGVHGTIQPSAMDAGENFRRALELKWSPSNPGPIIGTDEEASPDFGTSSQPNARRIGFGFPVYCYCHSPSGSRQPLMNASSHIRKFQIVAVALSIGVAYLYLSSPEQVVVQDTGKVTYLTNQVRATLQGKGLECALATGDISPRLEGEATGSFCRCLNCHLVFLWG